MKEKGHETYPFGPNVEGVFGVFWHTEGNCVSLDYSSSKRGRRWGVERFQCWTFVFARSINATLIFLLASISNHAP